MTDLKQIPKDWEIKRIDKCCNILDSQRIPLSGAVRSTMQGNIPYYGANGLLDYIDNYIFDENLILVAEDGGHFGDYQNRTIAYKIKGKSWVNNHAHILKPKEKYSFDYIFYQLEHKNIVPFINGSTREKLNQSDLRAILISVPKNPKEQTAIATILSKVDEAIEATRQSIKAAEKLKKALMQNLLTGKLKPDGTWRTDDEFYEDEKFGKVPVGWKYDKVKNLTERVTDGEHLSPDFHENGSYLLSAEDIKDDGVSFSKAKYVRQNDCKKFRIRCNPDFGDVLIVSRGAGIGRTCRITTYEEFCLMGSVILIKPNNKKLHGGFLAQYFKSYSAWIELQKLSGTTAQQAIYLTHIKKVRLIYPADLSEQKEISKKLESFDINIADKQTKIQTLQRLKKSLMQNLLTGKVRIDVEAINKIISEQQYGR